MNKAVASNIITKDREGIEEFKAILTVIANWMATPLVLFFWLADILYVAEYATLFLLLRLTIIPVSAGCKFFTNRVVKTITGFQWLSTFYATLVALPINIMIMLIPNVATGYYAGLNLVAIGSLSFVPFNRKFLTLTIVGIYGPYLATCIYRIKTNSQLEEVLINSFFIFGSIVICLLIRFFQNNLRQREFESRMKLHQEILNRDVLIAKKTEEGIRLNTLSAQFSPQIVRAIKDGRLDIETAFKKTSICAIYVDIKDCNEKLSILDQSEIDLVLSRFMDTVITTFMKYDLTIDKIQGDGISAFANEPIAYDDYVQRVCNAAIEVKSLIGQDIEFYTKHWKEPLQVRMGISQGEANVGFYGSKKYFKSYTSLGKPMGQSIQLVSMARANQILIDRSVEKSIKNYGFSVYDVSKDQLNTKEIVVEDLFELNHKSDHHRNLHLESSQCPRCESQNLHLNTDPQGHFVLRCRACNYEIKNSDTSRFKPF